MALRTQLPPQQIPFYRKTKEWRKKHLDWADSRSYLHSSAVRKAITDMRINENLYNGILDMDDLNRVINNDNLDAEYLKKSIPHYPILNTKIQVLLGEELSRVFDFTVTITNPNSVSEIEERKKEELKQSILAEIQDLKEQDEESFNKKVQEIEAYFTHTWKDLQEESANYLLQHYWREKNLKLLFNNGFLDAFITSEEIYQADVVGGEPEIIKLDPKMVRIFRSSNSRRVEDADVITIEGYWSPGKIIDHFYDQLTPKDLKYLEAYDNTSEDDGMRNESPYRGLLMDTASFGDIDGVIAANMEDNNFMSYDSEGNFRVLQVYWKSRRRVKLVTSFNIDTGEVEENLYPENYKINETLGESEKIFYINEWWEGTKIGKEIYVQMRPKQVQYRSMVNPAYAHPCIVGTIYSFNNNRPYSMVDMMKHYNYLYDATHDRLNSLISKNWGKVLSLDLASMPRGWDIDQWLHYAKTAGLVVKDSFKEGNIGPAKNILAGSMNNASSGVVDAEFGNSIQGHIMTLEYLKNAMSEVVGISKQREGQISNRETVGGVERATLQSSHITEWYFATHDDTKKRALECFLYACKVAMRNKNKKFRHVLPDNIVKMVEIDGEEFSMHDYGLTIDDSQGTQRLNQKLDMLAQAALQNQTLSFTSIMQLYNSNSLAEKQRIIREEETRKMQQQQEQLKQQQEIQQQQLQIQQQMEQSKMQQEDLLNQRDNETKIAIAQLSKQPDITKIQEVIEDSRQFTEEMNFNREKLDKEIAIKKEDNRIKEKALKHKSNDNKRTSK